MAERLKVSDATASDDSGGEPAAAAADAFICHRQSNTFIVGLIIVPNDNRRPTHTHD